MYIVALDSTKLRVDYCARSANADQHPAINPATAAFAFAQKSAEALLTPHPEHVHNGRTRMPLTDPAILAHCNFAEAANGVDGKHPILQKGARASLLSLPTAALRRLVEFKREAETAANITCGTEQGLEMSTDASVRSGGKQVLAAYCELNPPAAVQPNATGSYQDRVRLLRDMRLLLLKARKTTQRDDNAQPGVLVWMLMTTAMGREDDTGTWTEKPGWYLYRVYLNPNKADLHHAYLELAVPSTGRPHHINAEMARSRGMFGKRPFDLSRVELHMWDAYGDTSIHLDDADNVPPWELATRELEVMYPDTRAYIKPPCSTRMEA